MEMNLSETAFVSFGWTKGSKLCNPENPSLVLRTLRWFTPTNEVPLCGHATVASAKVITEIQLKKSGTGASITFESKFRGKLGAEVGSDGFVSLNFPSNPTHPLKEAEHPWLKTFLPHIVKREEVLEVHFSPGTEILFIRLKDELGFKGLAAVKPNYQAMLAADTQNFVHDVIVTVKGEGGGALDFYSRFFAPWDGINEDPVTGLAHTVLTPYWTKELLQGKESPLKARQHSARGGDLECTLLGDRVKIKGEARIGLKGELFF